MTDTNYKDKESVSIITEIEQQLEDILKQKKSDIEKDLEVKINKEREEAQRLVSQIEEDMTAEKSALGSYKDIISEYEIDKGELKKRIKAHLDNAVNLQNEIEAKTFETMDELKKIDELNLKLEEITVQAEEKIGALKKNLKEKFDIQPPLVVPEDNDDLNERIQLELQRLNKIKELLESDQIDSQTEESDSSAGNVELSSESGEEATAESAEEPKSEVEVDESTPEEEPKAETEAETEEEAALADDSSGQSEVEESEAEPTLEMGEENEDIDNDVPALGLITEEQEAASIDPPAPPDKIEFEDFSEPRGESEFFEVNVTEPITSESADEESEQTEMEVDPVMETTFEEEQADVEEDETHSDLEEDTADEPAPKGGIETEIIKLNSGDQGTFNGKKVKSFSSKMTHDEEPENGSFPLSKQAAEEMLRKYRKVEGMEGEGEIAYYENEDKHTLDGEFIINSIGKSIEYAKTLYDKLSRTSSPKDQFFVKQEIIQHQEEIRKLMLGAIRMCEKEDDFLPSFTHDVLNLEMLKETLEKVSMENWSNPEDFLAFEEFVREWKEEYYQKITPSDKYLESIFNDLKIVV